ncbi:bifunctional 4-hydroxy-2-oxoglutarate aldolase/2-dehydro-3-deoxy-phosphogluconate aldolase [Mangrovimicrobium sediminis]|uniref:2-dehydro-3-deoxy-phosphogluconate aldolase n=1 Tax=Mangrovimicrobium sediminis TaxID=2562682 RepID=A0A4Z0M1F3_9GAMM|nr:bifunctional 4-hydroxy-2-oxoglutarate aldolase/2-dehydro-3-deoxy-phosphogluconate aldolase [Haliea sp. SAOS-164]TGD73432.1 bifunctional 4-hydroxy-2-oxoglutarate aldolase/2-dehydro-3-deoxy-phosphogluconate aldolase [Haliea sp. SAOS-164]
MESLLRDCRVLPVVTARDVASTVALARALQRGGMRAIEITLRTPAALEAIAAVRDEVPEILVAAGTVNTPQDVERVVAAGVGLALSPGATPQLLAAAAEAPLDFIPGIASASELMAAQAHGFGICKLFPAAVLGGIDLLRALGGPFPEARFCPTGGLGPDNFRDYLAQPNVVCCGGSWMVAGDLVSGGEWETIESLAREAMH